MLKILTKEKGLDKPSPCLAMLTRQILRVWRHVLGVTGYELG